MSFKEKENEFKKIEFELDDIYSAVEYGFKYAKESQNEGFVPKGNILQMLDQKHDILKFLNCKKGKHFRRIIDGRKMLACYFCGEIEK